MTISISDANRLFAKGDYLAALEMYNELMASNSIWRRLLTVNHRICISKVKSSAVGENEKHVDDFFDCSSDITIRKKILIADFRYPRFDTSAGELATYGIIKIFAQLGYEVIFIPKESTELDAPYIKALRRLGVTCIEKVCYDNFQDKVGEVAKGIDIAYIFRPDVARMCIPVIRVVSSRSYIFYHAPDVYFRREKAQHNIESAEGAKHTINSERIEQIVLDEVYAATAADHVVCVSNGDSVSLKAAMQDPNLNKSDLPTPEISTFPVLYLERKTALPNFADTSNICFVGSSEHTPNRDALRWFLETVWLKLSVNNPDLYFHVIGKTSETEKSYYEQFKNVVVVGWVDSIEETLPKYKLSVAPLRFGAGIKGKVGTSLMVGVPCIASNVAIEDMGLTPFEEIILADSVDDYINQITRLLENENEWLQLSRKGAIKAEQLYSHDATFKRFIQILNDNSLLDNSCYLTFITNIAKTKKNIIFPFWGDDKNIDISIIVPAYNNLELSRMCLASIYYSILPSHLDRFEVIYADDCSDPHVIPELKSQFANIVVSKTKVNSGFVVNTNTAATMAKGRFIVLLNNDAVVMPSWLDGLLRVIQSSENCHVAGSKLLYANGQIQEAGAGIWTDGRSCSFGRGPEGSGLPSSIPKYNYITEVDYVSFASVVVRKSAWETHQGLSTEFGLGYYDDSDFCMRVRNSGGLTLFAPESEVVHVESGSFSKRNCKEIARQKQKNNSIFRKKWANQLFDNHPYYEYPSYDPGYGEAISKAKAARHRILTVEDNNPKINAHPRRHILYFSPFPSHPANHGNQTTIQKFGQFLQAEGHIVHFALMQSSMYSEIDFDDMNAFWDSLDLIKTDRFPSCNGKDIYFDQWYIVGIGEQIASLCAKYNIDTVICSYIFQSKLLDYVPNYILKIIDTHDKFTDRYAILDKLGKEREFFSCSRNEEGAYLSRADIVLARRDEEAKYFDLISTAKVYTVPHLEDKAYLKKGASNLTRIGLVASSNRINLDIVMKFITEIICQKEDGWGFEILIAGEVNSLINPDDPQEARVASHPAVNFLGYVENLSDFYELVDLIVCPIMSGTGINVKTVQALAYGMPLLATMHASKGVTTDSPVHQFQNVRTLVEYLFCNRFEAIELASMAKKSQSIYDVYIEWARNNFRQALVINQRDLRNGIGKQLFTNLTTLQSRKSIIATNSSCRRERLSLRNSIERIAQSLIDFGPTDIKLSAPLQNIQPDAGLGIWFSFKESINFEEALFLQVHDNTYPLHKSDDGLTLTASISPKAFSSPGNIALNLQIESNWELTGKKFESHTLASIKVA